MSRNWEHPLLGVNTTCGSRNTHESSDDESESPLPGTENLPVDSVEPPSAECIWNRVFSECYAELEHPSELKISVSLQPSRWQRLCTWFIPHVLVHALDLPRVYNGSMTNGLPLIVDSGASVCITPNRDDFTYYRASSVKIKRPVKD